MTKPGSKLTPEQRVLRHIREHNLVSIGQKIVVAVSGGPDSVCLLHILTGLCGELGIELHVAHLNHQLRGDESEADAAYVTDLARKLGVASTVESRDVRDYHAKHRVSLEEAAREVRYAFLAGVAASVRAERVAVGHTADDHVETILMHLIRGSGTRGLRGLRPVSRWPYSGTGPTIIRPLLELTREETWAYCKRYKLEPRTDTTNLSAEPMRNGIRRQLLPLLEQYNPQVVEALMRTARIAAEDLDFIDREADRLRGGVIRREGDAVVIDRVGFTALPPALQRHLLRAGIELLLGNLKDIEAGHIEKVLGALDKPAGKVIGLPDGLHFTIEYDRYVLGADAAALCPFPSISDEIALNVPGKTSLPGWDIEATVVSPSAVQDYDETENNFIAFFDFARAGKKLAMRHRLPGDRFQPLGMGQPKKLNQFMIDARIPRAWRQHVPIIASPEHIIWVVGWRIGERVRVTDVTRQVLRLKFKRRQLQTQPGLKHAL